MAMSWVAEAKATSTATPISQARWVCGSNSAMPARPTATKSCDSASQERRRPSLPSRGRRHWSSSGDHTHLKA
ncbi:hypothetical protein D9M71_851770 [compost metagenome]